MICSKCNTDKPKSAFTYDRLKKKRGRSSRCKECDKLYRQQTKEESLIIERIVFKIRSIIVMAKGIKNLTQTQKDILYHFIQYPTCVLLYHTEWLNYFLDNKYSVHNTTAISLIKRDILKLKGFHLDYPYGPPYNPVNSDLLLMTKENKVQIALGTIDPACYVYELNPKYLEALNGKIVSI